MDEYNAVYSLLVSKGTSPIPQGQDFVIKCLNPAHEDNSPSLKIDKVSGSGHCFSCGFNVNIFKHYGILTNPVSVQVAKLKEKLRVLSAQTQGLPMLDGWAPFPSSFRGISLKTLKHFNAFTTSLVGKMEDRIIFPIYDITGKTRFFLGRHLLSQANPRYINYPPGIELPVFPPALETPSKYIILVEGIFDMLNMYDNGATHTICVFGTQTIKANLKLKLLPFKAQGVTHIFIAFDGDTPGRAAATELATLIEELGFTIEIIHLGDGDDPGSLSSEDIRSIKEYCDGKSCNH